MRIVRKRHPELAYITVDYTGQVYYSDRPLRHGKHSAGYACVHFDNVTHLVHDLVCAAWHGPRPEGAWVRHLDGSRDNHRPVNLRWGTPAENHADTLAHGRRAMGERHGMVRINEDQAREIRWRLGGGQGATAIGHVMGFPRHVVRNIEAGRTWRHVTAAGEEHIYDHAA